MPILLAPLPDEWKPSVNPWLIAISIMLATIMEVLDTSVANVFVASVTYRRKSFYVDR